MERASELSVLRDLGVEHGQGYLLGRPSPRPPWGTGPGATTAIVLP